MEKSYVTVETKICPICGKEEDSGSILLDKRLNKSFEHKTCTGWGMCKECEELSKEYLALVVCKNNYAGTRIRQEDADRTGELIRIRHEVAKRIFNMTISTPMAFINEEAAAKIKGMVAE